MTKYYCRNQLYFLNSMEPNLMEIPRTRVPLKTLSGEMILGFFWISYVKHVLQFYFAGVCSIELSRFHHL